MRTLDFSEVAEGRHARPGAVAAIVLVHVLMLSAAWRLETLRSATVRGEPVPAERFFIEVPIALPAALAGHAAPVQPRATPAPAPAAVALPAQPAAVARSAPPADSGTVQPPLAGDGSPAVQVPPARAEPQAAAPAAPAPTPVAAAPVRAEGGSAPPGAALAQPAAAAPPVPGASTALPDGVPKVVVIQSLGASKASYIFPALTGLGPDSRPTVFQVEIGHYRDIKLALINHLIEQIRARYPDEIIWNSRVEAGPVRLSMRREDQEQTVKFLKLEIFGRHQSTTY